MRRTEDSLTKTAGLQQSRAAPSLPPLTLCLSGFPSDGPLMCALEQERRFRLPPKPPPPLPSILRGGQRLEAALSCPRFQRRPQQHLIRSLAGARGGDRRWGRGWRQAVSAGISPGSGLRVQCDKLFFTEASPEELTPHVMVLLAQHLARHRLREPQLLEAIAHFLVVQEAQLNSKVGLPLTFPSSSPSGPQTPQQA